MNDAIDLLSPFISLAQAAPGAAEPVNPLLSFLPMLLVFAGFYFLIIRPQQKRQKEHEKLLASLKEGHKVVTIGGCHGVVVKTEDALIRVRVAKDVVLEFNRSAIAQVIDPNAPAAASAPTTLAKQ